MHEFRPQSALFAIASGLQDDRKDVVRAVGMHAALIANKRCAIAGHATAAARS